MRVVPASDLGSQVPVLEVQSVTRVHASSSGPVRALGPISLQLARGEFVAVMGPSGSGKSTLLSIAGALDQPTEGRALIEGVDLSTAGPRQLADLRRRSVGSVFQDSNLLPGLTAVENTTLPLELDGVSPREARRSALEALDRVGLAPLAGRFPDDLSGGERQRIAIARSVVGSKSLILADEPTGALDSVSGEKVMRLLRELCDAGLAAIVATHNAGHAAWADRVLFLRDGKLVENDRASVAARVLR